MSQRELEGSDARRRGARRLSANAGGQEGSGHEGNLRRRLGRVERDHDQKNYQNTRSADLHDGTNKTKRLHSSFGSNPPVDCTNVSDSINCPYLSVGGHRWRQFEGRFHLASTHRQTDFKRAQPGECSPRRFHD